MVIYSVENKVIISIDYCFTYFTYIIKLCTLYHAQFISNHRIVLVTKNMPNKFFLLSAMDAERAEYILAVILLKRIIAWVPWTQKELNIYWQ